MNGRNMIQMDMSIRDTNAFLTLKSTQLWIMYK